MILPVKKDKPTGSIRANKVRIIASVSFFNQLNS